MVQEKTKKIVLNIGGMSCINCAKVIEKYTSKLNGVTHVTVNLAAEKAIIDYNPDIVDQKTIEATITDIGYQVIHEKAVIPVGGMTCINCAKTIEKVLNAKEGVYNAVVNFAAEQVTVEYNPEQISNVAIKKAITDTGYEVIETQKTADIDSESKARQRHIRRLKLLLTASVSLTIPIMILMWIPLLPMEINKIVMFLLATPVQFVVGWDF
jgi:Cu+-exporting ATPase